MVLTVAMPPCPLPASSEEPPVGVVAMLMGTATVARAALRAPALLRFKDGVFLRDRIVTGERSAVRVLLGGKATVTARERSSLTITEVPATSTVTLAAGRTAVAVSKAAMKPGQTIEIQTPNAVVAIRGTFVVAEVFPPRSTITILRGLVEVTKLDPATGRPIGPAVKVGAFQRVTVTDAGPIPAPQNITPETARALAADFTFLPKDAPAASLTPVVRAATVAALNDVTQPLIGNGGTTATSSVNAVGSLGSGVLTGVTAPIGGVIPTTPTDPTTLTGSTPLSGPIPLVSPTPLTSPTPLASPIPLVSPTPLTSPTPLA
ncbi:MAG: hypothetical protein DME03_08790, partial [Candidatus Rokuibacteriota bacterium]